MSLTKTVKATALSLGLGVSLAGTQANAQTISVQFVGGGSSALQGDYRFNATYLAISSDLSQAQLAAGGFVAGSNTFGPAAKPFGGSGTQNNQFGEGALPQAIETIGSIGTYKPAIQSERVIVLRSFNQQGDGTAIAQNGSGYIVGPFKRYVLTAAQATQPNTVRVSPDDIVVQTNPGVASSDPAARFEVVGDAEIRTTVVGGATNVAILLRSDSGQGVRYVANGAKIIQLPATLAGSGARFARVSPDPSGGPIVSPTFAVLSDSADLAVISSLTNAAANGGIAITAGLSDVAADTVIRYAGFGQGSFGGSAFTPIFNAINNPPNKFSTTGVAVQTLLLVYNSSIHVGADFTVNIPRHVAQNITAGFQGANAGLPIQWKNVDSRITAPDFIKNAYRENTSGTRMTYVVDILRHSLTAGDYLTENQGGYTSAPAANPQLGTGTMLNTVNGNADAFGYAFVTGGAGNSKPNIRVAAYEGVLPYQKVGATAAGDISGPSTFLPNNGTTLQPAYGSSIYYTETVNGRYPLWSVANAFATNPQATSFINSIVNAAKLNAPLFYKQGLVLASDLSDAGTFRDAFTSAVTGETVTDGLEINFDAAGTSLPSPVVQ